MLSFSTANGPLQAMPHCLANYETLDKVFNVTLVKSTTSSLTFEAIERNVYNCRATVNCINGYQEQVCLICKLYLCCSLILCVEKMPIS